MSEPPLVITFMENGQNGKLRDSTNAIVRPITLNILRRWTDWGICFTLSVNRGSWINGMKDAELDVMEADPILALALGTGDLLRSSLNAYNSQLSAELDLIEISKEGENLRDDLLELKKSGFSNREGFKKILKSPLAQDIMYIIWRESEYVTETAISSAGLNRKFQSADKLLTRNSLNNTICDNQPHLTASGGAAIKRSLDRICCALEVFGLVERSIVRDNLKPMHGTKLLHSLMSSVHLAVSQVFSKQLLSEGSAQND